MEENQPNNPDNNENQQGSKQPDPKESGNEDNPVDKEAIGKDAINGLLKNLGVDSSDDLKSIVDAKKQSDEQSKSDVEKLQGQLDKSTKSGKELASTVDQLKAENSALKAGISKEHSNDAVILAQAYVTGGQAKDIDKAIAMVVKNNPSFVGQKLGKDGSAIEQNSQNTNNGGHKSGIAGVVQKLNQNRITN